nr:probable isoprenylcysteine alpha-carbonyl methylesterase ICMEL1 isoform X4 [Nicotiana tomentosiformis]
MFLKEYLLFVTTYIAKYGGDPSRQSRKLPRKRDSWSVSKIKAYFGLSGGYNLFNLVDHFHSRGLYRSMFLSIMEGDQGLGQYSPQVMVQDPNIRNDVSLLPPTILFHGTADYSIPCDSRIRC